MMSHDSLDPSCFDAETGLAWTTAIPAGLGPGDTAADPNRSTLLLFEDAQPLGPAHAPHATIREIGAGAFSHWGGSLYFSTSDDTDPRQNGREYRIFRDLAAASAALGQDAAVLVANAEQRCRQNQGLIRLADDGSHALRVIHFLNKNNIHVTPKARILDFGCGDGAFVYRMRELGFDCFGFDLHEYVEYRSDVDRSYFAFVQNAIADSSDMTIDNETYSLPFSDASFDIIHSTTVLEHLADLDIVMRECRRVLKPGGVCLHFYPGRFKLVEPHIMVPFASFFHPPFWLAFWARRGIRNEFQNSLPWRSVVESNTRYFRTGLFYRSHSEIIATAKKHFKQVRIYPPRRWSAGYSTLARIKETARAMRQPSPFHVLAQLVVNDVMLCDARLPLGTDRSG